MVRLDPADAAEVVKGRHVEPMVMGGREMSGWLRVAAAGLADDVALAEWVGRGVALVRSLPPK